MGNGGRGKRERRRWDKTERVVENERWGERGRTAVRYHRSSRHAAGNWV